MGNLVGVLVLALFAVGIAIYVVRSYAKMTPKGTAKHFGLEPDERVAQMWVGEADVDVSTAERLTAAVTGLVAGALLGGIGVATVRAPGVTAMLTSKGRLVLVCEQPNGRVAHIAFASPHDVSIRHAGAGDRRVQGGRSARFELAGRDGIPLRVLLHESAVAYLARWQAGAATAS